MITFPPSPTVGQQFSAQGKTWEWTGVAWRLYQQAAQTGISLSGRVATYADLPGSLGAADAGKAYLVDADGLIYVWNGAAFPGDGDGVTISRSFIGASARNVGSVSATSTSTQVPLPTEDYDTTSIFDPATSRFTVPAGLGGYWRITYSAIRNSGSGTAFLFIRKNGTGSDSYNLNGSASGGQNTNYAFKSLVVPLVAGDYLTLTIYSDGGGVIGYSPDPGQATIMQMEYLGPL